MPAIPGPPKDEYTVGWICALPSELAAAIAMLDEEYEGLKHQDSSDTNTYRLGRIGNHNVVMTCLPAGVHGIVPAASGSNNMARTFESLRFGLMVGIGGGAPNKANDIRLGDIVVSQPSGTSGGVIQYDRGKTIRGGKFERTGSLNAPPTVLLTALSTLKAEHNRLPSKIPQYLAEMIKKFPKMRKDYTHQGEINDRLYQAGYEHPDGALTCELCDPEQEVTRDARDDSEPRILFGTIASGSRVIKHAETRERLQRDLGVLCFETEAAGLMSDFPCLVIRGICDYSDSHKNGRWQKYAAASAAAFAKELLQYVSAEQVRKEAPIVHVSGKWPDLMEY
jgi:nucleoside phosphorylase